MTGPLTVAVAREDSKQHPGGRMYVQRLAHLELVKPQAQATLVMRATLPLNLSKGKGSPGKGELRWQGAL